MTDPARSPDLGPDDVDYNQDVQAFYGEHADEVRGFLRRIGTPAEYIDDIVDDAFLAARRIWETLPHENRRAYVFKVARNQRAHRVDELAKHRRRYFAGQPIDSERDPRLLTRDHADAIIDRLTLESALAKLSDRQREVIVLRKIADLDVAETATVLGIPQGTVKSDLHRGMAALQQLLSIDGEGVDQ